jgi:hypothetical protein
VKERDPDNVFEKNVKKLINSVASHTGPDAKAAFQRRLIDSVLEEVQRERPGDRRKAIRFVLRTVVKSRIAKLAAAAMIVIAVGFLVIHTRPRLQTLTDTLSPAAKSPGEMMTAMSLKIAYRKGGLETVEKQCDKAFGMLGLQPTRISIRQLLNEFNGQEPERNKL